MVAVSTVSGPRAQAAQKEQLRISREKTRAIATVMLDMARDSTTAAREENERLKTEVEVYKQAP